MSASGPGSELRPFAGSEYHVALFTEFLTQPGPFVTDEPALAASHSDEDVTLGQEQLSTTEVEGNFHEAVRCFYVALMELQSGDREALGRVLQELHLMRTQLCFTQETTISEGGTVVEAEMLADCERKAGNATLDLLRTATSVAAPDPEAAHSLVRQCIMLGQETKAANIYGGFLVRSVQEDTDESLRGLESLRSLRRLQIKPDEGDEQAAGHDSQPHVTGLSRVLGDASRSMQGLRDLQEGPCPISMVAATRIKLMLNELAVSQAVKVIQWYKEDCEVQAWHDRCLDRSNHLVIPDLDFALDELQLICGICNRYVAFVEAKREEVMDLLIQVQELVGCYVSMEDAYCALNVAKAIRMCSPTEVSEGVLVSTIVEDVPMILNRSIRRATETLSDQALMAVANRATELLSPESEPSLSSALQALVHDRSVATPRRRGGGVMDGGAIDEFSRALERQLEEEEGEVPHQCIIYAVNSADWAVAAMNSMRTLLLELSQDRGEDSTRGRPIESVAEDLGRVVKVYERHFKSLVGDFVERYVSSGLLEYLGETLRQVDYKIDGATYEKESAGTDVFVSRYLEHMFVRDKVMKDCSETMTENALVVFVEKLAERLSMVLIDLLRRRHFNDWGAVKLRHQVRLLHERLVEMIDGKATLLPQFAVLDRYVFLLNLDNPSELLQYQCSDSPSVDEAIRDPKAVLRQRIDFDFEGWKALDAAM